MNERAILPEPLVKYETTLVIDKITMYLKVFGKSDKMHAPSNWPKFVLNLKIYDQAM